MKKQFLLLIVALMASVTMAWGQAVHNSNPRTVTCAATSDAYHPIAGVPYTYSAGIDPTGGTAYWFATTATTFIAPGGILTTNQEAVAGSYVLAATDYRTPLTANTSPTSTTITWTSQGIANATVAPTDPPKLFVVVDYTAPVAGCANNLKVYPVRPINAFVVDIKNMTQDATPAPVPNYGDPVAPCFPGIQSAVYVPGTDGSVDYDFGVNYLYFEVIAANFSGSYTPSFRLAGLQGDQTADIDWGYTIGTYDKPVTAAATNGDFPGTAVTTVATNTSTGVSIYVRVTVHNNDYEGIADTPISLAVEAVNSATPAQPDVDNEDCTKQTAYHADDTAIQTLKRRPIVTSVAPNTFLPVQP